MLCLTPSGYRLLVPERFWRTSTQSERLAILRHELAHYRRGDVVKSWLVRLLALPHWFNPAAWRAVRMFEQAGEWSCDRAAAGPPAERIDYLRALQRLVEMQTPIETLAGRCAQSHPLVLRVKRLLVFSPLEDSLVRKLCLVSAALLLAAAHTVRVELVARADEGQATVESVKKKIDEYDARIETIGQIR